MAERGNPILLATLSGFNENPSGRLMTESPDCENVIGEASGFSVWRGRKSFFGEKIGENSYVFAVQWPDRHKSILVYLDGKIGVIETGALYDLTGELEFAAGKRNPISMTRYARGKFVCGADYLRSQPWYWDGDRDTLPKVIETTHNPRTLCEFGGRLWAFGFEETPLYGWYSPRGEATFTGSGAMEFRDGKASELMGMMPLSRNLALVWGDKSLWAVQFSPSWPEFSTQIVEMDCDCIAFNSIVNVPGQGIFWQGRNNLWALVGDRVVDVSLSPDARKAQRVASLLSSRPQNDLFLASSFWHRKRNGVLFSWPTKHSKSDAAFIAPKGLFLRLADLSLWPVSYGVESATEWLHQNEPVILGSNRAGGIDLIDYNIAQDHQEFIKWHWESDWLGDPTTKSKFVRAYLTRPLGETRYVAIRAWKDYERGGVSDRFDTQQDYDVLHPGDQGAPPAPIVVNEARIGLTGRRLKIRLENQKDGDTYQGPGTPMMDLAILTR